jgi:hypothetical protein
MPVTYYPAQVLGVSSGAGANLTTLQLELVQSADVDFSVSRQDIFEFGNLYAVDNIQVEPPTVTLNFSYALASGTAIIPNSQKLGMTDFTTFLADTTGRTYTISGAGTLTVPSGLITSYSVEGSVGNIPTVSVSVQGLNATYSAGNPVFPGGAGFAGTTTVASIVKPQDISISLGGTTYEARSFTFGVDIAREYVNKLGSITPIANIMTAPPKVTVDAEIILNGTQNPKFDTNSGVNVVISCGDKNFQIDNAKLANFTMNTTLDDIQVASITLESPVTGAAGIMIEGDLGVAP